MISDKTFRLVNLAKKIGFKKGLEAGYKIDQMEFKIDQMELKIDQTKLEIDQIKFEIKINQDE